MRHSLRSLPDVGVPCVHLMCNLQSFAFHFILLYFFLWSSVHICGSSCVHMFPIDSGVLNRGTGNIMDCVCFEKIYESRVSSFLYQSAA